MVSFSTTCKHEPAGRKPAGWVPERGWRRIVRQARLARQGVGREVPERFRRALELNAALANALAQTGLRHLAARVEVCHTRFRACGCENGHVWARPIRPCHVRVCVFEARERSARAAKSWGPVLAGLDKPKHLVLAMPNSPMGNLADGIRRLWGAFGRLRRMPIWKERVRGALVSLEVTFNEHARSWHPHLHAILDAPYLPWEELIAAWKQASGAKPGESRTCWIGAADSRAIRELVKYATKMASLVRHPDALEEFLRATKRMRMLRAYGTLYGLKRAVEETPGVRCPDCGAPALPVKWEERVPVFWLDQVFFENGVWRLRAPP